MITSINQIEAVDIIVINQGLEALAIRSTLEAFYVQTRMHYIGNVRHLISLLQNPSYLHKMVIISCHGDEEGLLIPELAKEIEENMPFHKKLTFNDLSQILNLNNQIIINTGCCLGDKDFAGAFLLNGAKAYIGATGYINGNEIMIFIINFLYFRICKALPINKAFYRAQNISDEIKIMHLWSAI